MSLTDLVPFVDEQGDIIASASSGFTPSLKPSWTAFRNRFWQQNPQPFQEMKPVERDTVDPVADVQVPSVHQVATVGWDVRYSFGLETKKILVRSEYEEAERAAVLSCQSMTKVFMVDGTPGIGKSVFIFWLLMRRLALRLPTAIQVNKSYALLFDENGVSEFSAPDDERPYYQFYFEPPTWSKRIWALVDVGPEEPARIFSRFSPFFVVNVAASYSDPLRWLDKVPYEYFYMKPWSDSEVIQVRPFLPVKFTERQIWYLHKEFGASLRSLSHYAGVPSTYEDRLLKEIREVVPDRLLDIFRDPVSHHLSRLIVTIQPQPGDPRWREELVASRRVFELLWEEHIKNRPNVMSEFYHFFRRNSATVTFAGWIFELRVHQLLRKKRIIQLLPLRGHLAQASCIYSTQTFSDPMILELAASPEVSLVEHAQLQPNEYYRPAPNTFSGIDSLLLIPPSDGSPPILLMFYIRHNQGNHCVNLTDLEKVNRLGAPPNTRGCYVVATPENIRPRVTISAEYFGGAGPRELTPDEAFPVFRYPFSMGELFRN